MQITDNVQFSKIRHIVATTTSIKDVSMAFNNIRFILTKQKNVMINDNELLLILKQIIPMNINNNLQFFLLYALDNKNIVNTICKIIINFKITITEEIHNKIKEYSEISNINLLTLFYAPSEIIDYLFIINKFNENECAVEIILSFIRHNIFNPKMINIFLIKKVFNSNPQMSAFIIQSIIDKFDDYNKLLYLISLEDNILYLTSIKLILSYSSKLTQIDYTYIFTYLKQIKFLYLSKTMEYFKEYFDDLKDTCQIANIISNLLLNHSTYKHNVCLENFNLNDIGLKKISNTLTILINMHFFLLNILI